MKRLKTHELLEKLRDILVADADILAWCMDHYDKRHTVYLGVNDEDLPDPAAKYPVLVIYYAERKKSANVQVVVYQAEIGAGISDDDITGTDGDLHVTYEGLARVAELRELAERAIEKSHIGKVDVNGETSSDILFPLFSSNTILEIEWPKDYSRPVQ
jgi:hypothetical protein